MLVTSMRQHGSVERKDRKVYLFTQGFTVSGTYGKTDAA